MAHVLLAYLDPDLRETLECYLTDAGHAIAAVGDSLLALAALLVARCPMIVVLDDRLDAVRLLSLVAHAVYGDGPAPLGRHRYVVATTASRHRVCANLRDAIGALHAPLLHLPADLDALPGTVDELARTLLNPAHRPPAPVSVPIGMG